MVFRRHGRRLCQPPGEVPTFRRWPPCSLLLIVPFLWSFLRRCVGFFDVLLRNSLNHPRAWIFLSLDPLTLTFEIIVESLLASRVQRLADHLPQRQDNL